VTPRVSDEDPLAKPATVAKVVTRVGRDLGPPAKWVKWGGGWPDDIEAAILDAVFSAQAVYETKNGKGILFNVRNWTARRTRSQFTLPALATEISGASPRVWAKQFGNEQHSPHRRSIDPGGPSKAAAVLEVAEKLASLGIVTAGDITDNNVAAVKAEMRKVRGVGYATTNYFLMLLGRPGVKPDTMVLRFLDRTLGRDTSVKEADAIVTAAATQIGVQAHELDHAIWAYQRQQP
jgi:hypothetical protein